MLFDVCRIHSVGGLRVRPAGCVGGAYWLIGSGSAGLTQGCRCALPLQAWAGAYCDGKQGVGGRLHLVCNRSLYKRSLQRATVIVHAVWRRTLVEDWTKWLSACCHVLRCQFCWQSSLHAAKVRLCSKDRLTQCLTCFSKTDGNNVKSYHHHSLCRRSSHIHITYIH